MEGNSKVTVSINFSLLKNLAAKVEKIEWQQKEDIRSSVKLSFILLRWETLEPVHLLRLRNQWGSLKMKESKEYITRKES